MSGIVFLGTRRLDELKDFYLQRVGCRLWLEQADCALFRHDNLILGFCQRGEADTGGIITFFYESKDEVERMYDVLKNIALSPPAHNDKYRIYQFFARDPEGRMLEFQHFDHPVDGHFTGEELLLTRRSVREFEPAEVPRETLDNLFEVCRFAPTSRNCQSYYFKVIRDRDIIERLSRVREKSSSPIAAAPMAVAICVDPALTKRIYEDGHIAAYHLLLAAWCFGLGTCWIAAMDREDVKQMLKIPQDHYVATVSPLGYPRHHDKPAPPRKDVGWYLRERQ